MSAEVVSLEHRKTVWTPEECLAVAARRKPVRVLVIIETEDGHSSILSSDMTRKDQLWLAHQAMEAALTA
jgi:hypothetical protein